MSEDSEYEFFRVIQGYLEQAAGLVDLPPHVATILSQPKNEIIVHRAQFWKVDCVCKFQRESTHPFE